jgi:cephalosporin hydroxylase
LIGAGKIMTVDSVHREGRPSHERILYYTGSSTEPETIRAVNEFVAGEAPVVVFLDSDHSKSHVLKELRLYSEIVTVGSYLVVEDGNVNGHPVVPKFGPGPMEAIQEFLASDSRFQVDADREKFYVTFNPSGYLKRIA